MDEDKRAGPSIANMDMGPVITFSVFLLVLITVAGVLFELYALFGLVPLIIMPILIMSYLRRRVSEGMDPLIGSFVRPLPTRQAAAATPGHHSQRAIRDFDREKPEMGLIILWKLFSGSISLILGGIIIWSQIDFEITLFGIAMVIYGFYEIIMVLMAIFSSKSNRNIYRRGSELADARLTGKKIEKVSSSWFNSNRKKNHIIELEYHAYWPGRGREILRLNVVVGKRRYNKLDVGGYLQVRFASEAPTIALLEGELGFKQSAF